MTIWEQISLGFMLAWSTEKPQFIWLFLLFFCLEIIKRKLWTIVISFFTSMVIFLIFSWVLIPHWIPEWLQSLHNYVGYYGFGTTAFDLLRFFQNEQSSFLISIAWILLVVLITLALLFRYWQNKIQALDIILWSGYVTYLFHPASVSYEQLCFLIPLLYWFVSSQNKVGWRTVAWLAFIPITWISFIVSKSLGYEYDRLAFGLFSLFLILYFIFEKGIIKKPAIFISPSNRNPQSG